MLLRAGLAPDAFLAQQLGRPAYRLDPDPRVIDDLQRGCISELGSTPAFAYVKVPSSDESLLRRCLAAGMRQIETAVTLEREPFCGHGSFDPDVVRPSREEDELEIVRLAGRSFTLSRFHRDPAIGASRASAIKAAWARNYFRGVRGDAMMAAQIGGSMVGFLLALHGDDGTLIIDLVAVAEAHRRQGLCRAMTRAAQAWWPACRRIRVGTQMENAAALLAYQQAGFRIVATQHVLHLHLPRTPQAGGAS